MLVDVMQIEYAPILHSLMISKKFLQLYSSISLMIHLSKVQQKGNKFFHPRPTPLILAKYSQILSDFQINRKHISYSIVFFCLFKK